MKFATLALIATASADDKTWGQTCVKGADTCGEGPNNKCCNIVSDSKTALVCIDTYKGKKVKLADGSGLSLPYNCSEVAADGAAVTAVTATVAALSALYLAC